MEGRSQQGIWEGYGQVKDLLHNALDAQASQDAPQCADDKPALLVQLPTPTVVRDASGPKPGHSVYSEFAAAVEQPTRLSPPQLRSLYAF